VKKGGGGGGKPIVVEELVGGARLPLIGGLPVLDKDGVHTAVTRNSGKVNWPSTKEGEKTASYFFDCRGRRSVQTTRLAGGSEYEEGGEKSFRT